MYGVIFRHCPSFNPPKGKTLKSHHNPTKTNTKLISGGMTGLEFLRQYPPLSAESTIHLSWQIFLYTDEGPFWADSPTFHHHFWGDLLGVLVAIICIDTHLKLTCLLKRDYFHRKYIFQPLIFRGTFVSFLGDYILRPKNHVLVPKESSRKVKKLKVPGYLVLGGSSHLVR